MAKISFKACGEYGKKLEKYVLSMENEQVLKEALYEGAAVVADQIRSNLAALPTDEYRHLRPGEVFKGLSKAQKEDLLSGFGLSSIKMDRDGNLNTKAGFDGYGRYPTKAYPQGVPNALLARAAESGSTVRIATPFVRTAVASSRAPARKAMKKVLDDAANEIFKK